MTGNVQPIVTLLRRPLPFVASGSVLPGTLAHNAVQRHGCHRSTIAPAGRGGFPKCGVGYRRIIYERSIMYRIGIPIQPFLSPPRCGGDCSCAGADLRQHGVRAPDGRPWRTDGPRAGRWWFLRRADGSHARRGEVAPGTRHVAATALRQRDRRRRTPRGNRAGRSTRRSRRPCVPSSRRPSRISPPSR